VIPVFHSDEMVFQAGEAGFRVEWDGRTESGKVIFPGIYFDRKGKDVLLKRTLVISDGS
jgi:hypothetical protein